MSAAGWFHGPVTLAFRGRGLVRHIARVGRILADGATVLEPALCDKGGDTALASRAFVTSEWSGCV